MNATRGTPVGLAALAALALACNLDKGPTAPGAPIRADQVAAAVSSFVCDVDGATWEGDPDAAVLQDRKSTRLNSSHSQISYAVFCLKKKQNTDDREGLGGSQVIKPCRPQATHPRAHRPGIKLENVPFRRRSGGVTRGKHSAQLVSRSVARCGWF